MGIQGLMKVINDHAPGSIKENVIKNYFGRKICIDASMSLYQFLIAVRPDDTNSFTLTNDVGETTRYAHGCIPEQNPEKLLGGIFLFRRTNY